METESVANHEKDAASGKSKGRGKDECVMKKDRIVSPCKNENAEEGGREEEDYYWQRLKYRRGRPRA